MTEEELLKAEKQYDYSHLFREPSLSSEQTTVRSVSTEINKESPLSTTVSGRPRAETANIYPFPSIDSAKTVPLTSVLAVRGTKRARIESLPEISDIERPPSRRRRIGSKISDAADALGVFITGVRIA